MRRGCTITIMIATTLALACARGGDLRLERAGELQAEYVDRKQDIDGCMAVFGECLAGAPEPAEIAECAGDLQTCLQEAEEPEGIEPGGDGDPPGQDNDEDNGEDPQDNDTEGEENDGEDEAEDENLGDVCEPLLDACLEDPANFDPFCLDDFEECVEIQIAFELQELCDDVVAECLALDIPNFDCFDVCP